MKKILLTLVILLLFSSICFGEMRGLLKDNTVIFFSPMDIIRLPEVKSKEGDIKKYTETLIEGNKAIRVKFATKVIILDESKYDGIKYFKVSTIDRKVEGWVREYDFVIKWPIEK